MGICYTKNKLITKQIYNTTNELIYDGHVIIKDDKYIRNGIGIEYKNNKLFYKGEWLNDINTGFGVLYYQCGNIYFQGEFYNSQFIDGEEYYNNNDNSIKYKGKYKDNLYNDINAKLYYNDGNIKFDGYMKDNNLKLGKLYNINNILIYDGEFKNNMYNNNGILYTDKYEYAGQFINGKINGNCILSFNSKIIFKGIYLNDNKIEGEEYEDNKLIYKGTYKYNKYNNYGTLYDYINNTIYIGNFKSGMRHNSGKIYNLINNLLIFEGNFHENTKHGLGKYYYNNGNILFYGNFINNIASGVCTEYDINHKIISHGLYKDNKCIKSIEI